MTWFIPMLCILLIQGWLAHLVCHLAPCFPWNSSCGWFKFKFYSKEFPPHTNTIQVGVATSSCPLTEPGYRRFQDFTPPCFNSMASSLVRLVGSNSSSWGWCLKTMKVYHDSRKYRHGVPYPRLPIVLFCQSSWDRRLLEVWACPPPSNVWSSCEIFMRPESCARVYSDLASMWNMYQGRGWEAEGARNLLHASWHGQGHSCLSGEHSLALGHL